jgi:hypothetical protein
VFKLGVARLAGEFINWHGKPSIASRRPGVDLPAKPDVTPALAGGSKNCLKELSFSQGPGLLLHGCRPPGLKGNSTGQVWERGSRFVAAVCCATRWAKACAARHAECKTTLALKGTRE